MADLSERLHVLLSPEQAAELKRISESSGQPVGQLVRDALDYTYRAGQPARPLQALRSLMEHDYIMEDSWQGIRELLDHEG